MNAHTGRDGAAPPRLQGARTRPLIRIVIVGHVDHGKSTLIGRLLSETGSLPEGKIEQLRVVSARRGMAFEWSFLLDALQTERDQGITIDTSQISFRTPARDFVLIDAPGHTEFLRNMITGAAQADAALLIVDAAEGVRDQTLRHAYLLHLLGIRQVVAVINKMDRVSYDGSRFRAVADEITGHLAGFGLKPAAVIPISARHGDGVMARTPSIAWYQGPTVTEALDRFAPAQPATALPLRLPVQAVYKFDDRRIVAGRLSSGAIAVGDEIEVTPSGRRAVVRSIEAWPVTGRGPEAASAGQSVGITLDRELFIARGDMIARRQQPAAAGRRLTARIFWLHETPLEAGATVTVRIGTAETAGTITAVANTFDPGGGPSGGDAGSRHAGFHDRPARNRAGEAEVRHNQVGQNQIGEVGIALAAPLAADLYAANPRTGRVALEYDGRIAGGGLVVAVDDGAAVAALPALRKRAAELEPVLSRLDLAGRLAAIRQAVSGAVVFTTSFGLEDQVILHHICEAGLDIAVVTIDTGRLFPETYATWEESEQRYGRHIRAVYPDKEALERLVAAQGINGFYRSKDARLACCDVRKVAPLTPALAAARGWITGLRADQSAARANFGIVTADEERGLLKFNPMIDWSRQAAEHFAKAHQVPTNPLHQKGFPSIGCAPCTRAVRPGEGERAGRWWWEDESKKE
ncbi:MAG: phosphoadenylyl-sulfate reductase, partial [Bradyrhizobiaceae bacterium]|nr:phosphoadenylyl-sulfate reductase [Bradyrhizobiaceae bacterium]